MDQKIAKYKKILNLNLYAWTTESQTFEGFLNRTHQGRFHQKSKSRRNQKLGNLKPKFSS